MRFGLKSKLGRLICSLITFIKQRPNNLLLVVSLFELTLFEIMRFRESIWTKHLTKDLKDAPMLIRYLNKEIRLIAGDVK